MKSLSRSINKAKRQTIETKTVIKIKIQRTENTFLPVFAETKLQINRTAI